MDNNHFLTTSSDNCLRLWELPDLRAIKYAAFTDYVYGVHYDPENKLIYLGDGEGQLLILNMELEVVKKRHLHTDLLSQVLVSGDRVITASLDYTVKISDINTLETQKEFNFKEPIWNIRLVGDIIYVCLEQRPSVKIINYSDQLPLQWELKTIVEASGTKNTLYANSPSLNLVYNLSTGETIREKCHGLAYYQDSLVTMDTKRIILHSPKGKRVFQFPCKDNPSIMDVKEVGDHLIVGLDNGKVMSLKLKV